MTDSRPYPRVELTFAEDDERQFLLECTFKLNADSDKRHIRPPLPNPKNLRAMCILMLLAKYRGVRGEPEGRIPLSFPTHEDTWIRTLAQFGGLKLFFANHFDGCEFLHAGRGGDHKDDDGKPPEVLYRAGLLPLENVHIYARPRKALKEERKALSGESLVKLAKRLERVKGWKPIVADLADRFQKYQSGTSVPELPVPKTEWLSASWMDFLSSTSEAGRRLRERLDAPHKGETWYVITMAPKTFMDWASRFQNAVENHRVRVKWINHAPTAGEHCVAIKAQWRMIFSQCSNRDPVDDTLAKLSEERAEFQRWVGRARAEAAEPANNAGVYEFFQSNFAHPFMAFMAVPPVKEAPEPMAPAPAGTVGFFAPYLLFPAQNVSRWGLYLETPNSILNLYYHSIVQMFVDGVKAGYLTHDDLETPKRRKK